MIINAGFIFEQVLTMYDAVLFQKNGDDHTNYFESNEYERPIYDDDYNYTVPDKSEAIKKHEQEREQRSKDELNQTLMDMVRNIPEGDTQDVSKDEHKPISSNEDDDLYDRYGGRRKTRK